MRNITLKQWVLAVLFLLMPWVADAAGLGRLTVLSSLGQPLNAEIDLVSVEKDELATLVTRLASPDAYKQANLQYGPALIGLRLSIEKRPNGQPYIRIMSTRPVNEAFIDLMIELSWATGRILREYTALIDPPGFALAPVTPAPVAVPESRPALAPSPPPAAAVPAPAKKAAIAAPVATRGKDYGPIQRGETLYKIANSVKPEGVTLEQMLVGLYRSNPDVFINKNMNLVKSGKILRVPEKEELAAVTQQEAVKEVRVQAADWNAYRRKLADAAAPAPESRAAAGGKITPRVEDRAAAKEAKDVVRLSKVEPPKGARVPGNMTDRIRTLEEEVFAREKTLAEANARIAQLEKTLKDMQRLMEIKSSGMAAAQQKAEAKPPAQAPAAPAAKPPAPKPEIVAAAKPAAAPQPEPPKPAADAATPPAEAKKDEPQTAAVPAQPAVETKAEQPQPKPKPKVVLPPPPPEPDFVDILLGEPLYLAAGGGVILLGGLAFLMARRRRSQAEAAYAEPIEPASTPSKDIVGDTELTAAAGLTAEAGAATVAPMTAGTAAVDEVDPLEEAEVYIAYGRDTQAEEILKEAIAKNPNREDVQLKLLGIYAARKDKSAFNGIAGGFHKLTGGQGENWLKVAAMGYALDPGNPLYEAGKDAPAAEPLAGGPTSTDLDFDLGLAAGGVTTTDIALDAGATQAQMERTEMMDPGAMQAMAGEAEKAEESEKTGKASEAPLMPDFTLDIPDAGGTPVTADISLDANPPADTNMIDFNIELPKVDVPEAGTETETKAAVAHDAPAQKGRDTDAGLEFKIDVGDINLNLDDEPKSDATAAEGEKDAHWYDVQTKFDLAKAYQEMGDKDGAREILQEVVKEGDAEQQTEAKKLLETLN